MYLQMNTHNGRDGGRAVCYDQPFYKLRPTFDNHLSTLSLQQTNTTMYMQCAIKPSSNR